MVRSDFLVFATLVISITVLFQQALALHCWHCNSVDQKYCDDPFDTDHLSAAQRAGNFADCQRGDFGAPVCIKMISTQNDAKIIRRLCSATANAADEACKANGADNICEKCDTDGCNGAIQYGPIAILIVLPIAIAKFLLF